MSARGHLIDDEHGRRWYRIDGLEAMEPFLLTVVSSTDLWMFLSSRGPLTAGRGDADHALLPYETDDRLHRAAGITGPVTLLTRPAGPRREAPRREAWRPFGPTVCAEHPRALAKTVLGDRVLLEERHPGWGLRWRTTWAPSPRHGWVRQVELHNDGEESVSVDVVDGLLDVMPAGVEAVTEQRLSNLVDAYKRAETGPWGSAAVYSLESGITDRAEPSEVLSATVVWSTGAPDAQVHLDERVLQAALQGHDRDPVPLLTGRRGAYLLRHTVTIAPGGSVGWMIVADTDRDHAQVRHTIAAASHPDAAEAVRGDIERGGRTLEALLQRVDAVHHTGEPVADAHHLSNTLFNAMRGGVLAHGRVVRVAELSDHLAMFNRPVADRHRDALAALGEALDVDDLRRWAQERGDPDLQRLVLEHLPLTFSRRHGDPSRPWNRFSIPPRAEDGTAVIGYQGNWRDIFQNWEGLMAADPAFLPHAVARFVDASTIDGYNPYRISHEGIDWEVPEPEDPWSNIGYWGDHQIVYLHRLLLLWQRLEPDGLRVSLQRKIHSYADVPYRLADHDHMVVDPRATITYDVEHATTVAARVEQIGADGRLLVDGSGDIVRATLLEKLVVPLLAKLCALVPGGGVWMNTQRPEWNDANNALAGWGLSVVTTCHLHAYTQWLADLLETDETVTVTLSAQVADWLAAVTHVMVDLAADPDPIDDARRRAALDRLGRAAAAHRRAARETLDVAPTGVPLAEVTALCRAAVTVLADTVDAARRDDGLYESYRLLSLPTSATAAVEPLGPMLEGQVAALSSGLLDAEDTLRLVDALYDSAMYRPDQDSFMLYPAASRPSFLDRNTVPSAAADALPDPVALEGVVVVDEDGALHFAPAMTDAQAVRRATAALGHPPSVQDRVVECYEQVFDHHRFTGRSGAMHAYEGIGSIYWHMVAKLLLAVQERWQDAHDRHADPQTLDRLAAAYRRIRAGLGFTKSPEVHGAIPTDCYSHTPAHAGAQQPGMTGQVKEEILTRLGELGVRFRGGSLDLLPGLLRAAELLPDGAATATFHLCGVEVRVDVAERSSIAIRRDGAWSQPQPGLSLGRAATRALLVRDGSIDTLSLTVERSLLRDAR